MEKDVSETMWIETTVRERDGEGERRKEGGMEEERD